MSYYVYKFLNSSNEIIYIGKTTNLIKRLEEQHFTKRGHLPQECYQEVSRIYTSKFKSKTDMDIYERYLISKYTPKYNVQNNVGGVTIELNEPYWIIYSGSFIEFDDRKIRIREIAEMVMKNYRQYTLSKDYRGDRMPIYTIEILMKNGEDLREIYENYYPGLCTKCEHNKGSDIEYFDENYEIYLPYQCDEQCIICDVENIRNVRFKKLYSIWKGEEISTTEMGNRLIFVD